MSFENGYDINNYIKETINKYESDSDIFDKSINLLNIFMQRKDWPMCFGEFKSVCSELLGGDVEFICRTFSQFESQKNNFESQQGWNFDLSNELKKDLKYFCTVLNTIIEDYYSYVNNPLGVKVVFTIHNDNNGKLIRLLRTDGEKIDFRMSEYELKQLISTLKGMIGE